MRSPGRGDKSPFVGQIHPLVVQPLVLVVEAYVYTQALVRQGEFMRAQSPLRSDSIIGSPCRVRGFTIVELMVTIAVAAILL
ncbi:MAG: prepilin-type N-terminal cleavage/methylation domain-containing protein, partial [Xanthomonadaceae bacterium]|nr:prepilin-type N-terminal cleavage/methylation domain-containing protein [Xanthomonadaceae bacterium]